MKAMFIFVNVLFCFIFTFFSYNVLLYSLVDGIHDHWVPAELLSAATEEEKLSIVSYPLCFPYI